MKVTGDSLLPDYVNGDFVLVLKIPFLFNSLKRGDILVFRNEEYGTMIKRVAQVDRAASTVTVFGTHENSIDSRHFGPVQENDIIGKVIWRVKKDS